MPYLRSLGRDRTKTTPLTVHGVVRYQACDARVCYPMEQNSVSWTIDVNQLDFHRTMEETKKSG
jgi:hypothetical protein